jgi:hypothetical protein
MNNGSDEHGDEHGDEQARQLRTTIGQARHISCRISIASYASITTTSITIRTAVTTTGNMKSHVVTAAFRHGWVMTPSSIAVTMLRAAEPTLVALPTSSGTQLEAGGDMTDEALIRSSAGMVIALFPNYVHATDSQMSRPKLATHRITKETEKCYGHQR